jgi:selenide,water dikinase
VALPADISPAQQALLSDPQTSGGLLVSCAPEAAKAVLACFARHGFGAARQIGQMTEGSGIAVR